MGKVRLLTSSQNLKCFPIVYAKKGIVIILYHTYDYLVTLILMACFNTLPSEDFNSSFLCNFHAQEVSDDHSTCFLEFPSNLLIELFPDLG